LDSFYPNPCIDSNGIYSSKHTDQIVPIVYGLPSKTTIRQHRNGKISLAGCFAGCPKGIAKA
jgi:N-acetyl-gamma-glutamylphosphate reductase